MSKPSLSIALLWVQLFAGSVVYFRKSLMSLPPSEQESGAEVCSAELIKVQVGRSCEIGIRVAQVTL